MRVLLISRVQLNPYVRLLANGLEANGATCKTRTSLSPLTLLWEQRRRLDVIHLHWLELLYETPHRIRSAWQLGVIFATLMLARAFGIAIVYTMHNLAHHERRYPRLNAWGNRWLARHADAIHVHDEATASAVAQQFGRTHGVYVVPHGNYIGAYPDICTREEAKARFNLNESETVFLFLGGIRPYKGIEFLLDAFLQLKIPNARLLVAGHAHDFTYAEAIKKQAQRDLRVQLQLQHVNDDELQFYFHASDAAIFPYREVTTSGAALLGLSFGCPLIAPNVAPFSALAENGRGLLYEPENPSSLTAVLAAATQLNRTESSNACSAYAQSLDWRVLAQKHMHAYRFARKN